MSFHKIKIINTCIQPNSMYSMQIVETNLKLYLDFGFQTKTPKSVFKGSYRYCQDRVGIMAGDN